MKRYDIGVGEKFGFHFPTYFESHAGEWVKYEDVHKYCSVLRQSVQDLETKWYLGQDLELKWAIRDIIRTLMDNFPTEAERVSEPPVEPL